MGVALGWDFGVSYKHVIRVMLAAGRVSRCWVLLGSKAKGPRWVKNQPQPGSSNFNTPEKNLKDQPHPGNAYLKKWYQNS